MIQTKPIGTIFLWGLYLALFYLLYLVMKPFIFPILWAGIFTVIFSPVYKKALSITKHRDTLAATLTMIIIVVAVIIPGAYIISLIVSETIDFAKSIITQTHFDFASILEHPIVIDILKRLDDTVHLNVEDLRATSQLKLKELSNLIINKAQQLLIDLPSSFANFFITLFTTFFLLRDGKTFGNLLRNLLPLSKNEIEYYFDNLKKVVYVTFIGVLLTAVVQGLIAFISFYFIGVGSSVILGLLVALASLVPVVGSALVWVPVAIYLIITGFVLKGLLVIIVGVFFISFVDNFVRPIFLHQYLSLHLLLTFFSLFGGIKAFGFIGIFLGPIIISAFIGSCFFYQDYRLKLEEESKKNA